VPGRDLQNLVLDVVATERDVCEGRGGLRSGQDFGVDLPFVAFAAENEFSLVESWIDDRK